MTIQTMQGQSNVTQEKIESGLRQTIVSTNTIPVEEAAQKVDGFLSSLGLATILHREAGKTAVIGVHEELHAKVQTVITREGAVAAMYNGRIYSLNEPPDWAEYPIARKIALYYRKSDS